jgi:hypothetical protein
MPVNSKMMANMKEQYGSEKGERVYYAMENKMKSQGKKMPLHKEDTAVRVLTKKR